MEQNSPSANGCPSLSGPEITTRTYRSRAREAKEIFADRLELAALCRRSLRHFWTERAGSRASLHRRFAQSPPSPLQLCCALMRDDPSRSVLRLSLRSLVTNKLPMLGEDPKQRARCLILERLYLLVNLDVGFFGLGSFGRIELHKFVRDLRD
jgi:hypothetical protein